MSAHAPAINADHVTRAHWQREIDWTGFVNVHDPAACAGRHCVVHDPSDHHMRSWPMVWRPDRQQVERICPHGIGHPDPDQIGDMVHGCDGCCRPPDA